MFQVVPERHFFQETSESKQDYSNILVTIGSTLGAVAAKTTEFTRLV